MRECNGDIAKYTPLINELTKIFNGKYYVWYTGSTWACIQKRMFGIFKLPVPKYELATIHFSTGLITVHDREIYNKLLDFGKANGFYKIEKNYLTKGGD